MKDVIEMLLQKQANLEADREAEKALACEKIDADYDEKACKYASMLDLAGYEPPEVVTEAEAETEQVDTVEVFANGSTEEISAPADEPVRVY